MRKIKFIYIVFTLILLSVIQACDMSYLDKDIEDFDTDASLAIAVGNITYTVSELFNEIDAEDIEITENSDGIVSFVYMDTLTSVAASDVIEIPNQSFPSQDFSPALDIPSPGSPIAKIIDLTPSPFIFVLNGSNNEEFNKIVFDGGTLQVKAESTFTDIDINLTITLNSLKSNTDNSSYETTVSLNGTAPEIIDIDLADFWADLTDDGNGGITTNAFVMTVSVSIDLGIGDTITPEQKLSFSLDMTNLQFEAIYGDLKNQTVNSESLTTDFDVFDDFGTGTFLFADPTLQLIIDNSFGFPLGIDFGNIAASNTSETKFLLGAVTDTYQIINSPTLAQEGQTVRNTITIDNTNSNIVDLLALKPSQFTIDISATSNPNSDSAQNFILNTSALSTYVQVNMPLDVVFENTEFEQELDNINGADFEDLGETTLNIHTINTIPLGGSLEMVFYNDNSIVYTITEQVIFAAAPVDTNGISTGATTNTASFDIKGDDIKTATRAVLKLKMNTTNASSNSPVKLLTTNTLDISITTDVSIDINNN
ncbi:hypothetical protein Q4Q35_00885 [Flavivirga aquimarina]|uniref:Uncharacterized protein n=1 Tax=Flavivirga aquimarina TaxID=2027862 RepID=A0ABT8W5G1_9FLAO|nr:hypothetical protein [Flavivirga aquimarina]MDO5968350.1 hypothetical protein [Flavivirga aquimarina]